MGGTRIEMWKSGAPFLWAQAVCLPANKPASCLRSGFPGLHTPCDLSPCTCSCRNLRGCSLDDQLLADVPGE